MPPAAIEATDGQNPDRRDDRRGPKNPLGLLQGKLELLLAHEGITQQVANLLPGGRPKGPAQL